MKKLISILLCLTFSTQVFADAFSGFITVAGPYSQQVNGYLGVKFPDGSTQSTAASGALSSLTLSTYNSQGASPDGAQIIGSNLFMQSASSTFPGLVMLGNLTAGGADGIVISNGTNSIVNPSGVSIAQAQASSLVSGYLSSTDWTTFNSKQASGSYITALTGDVTATGPGSSAATVAKIQGTTVSGTTGTGNIVFSGSPALVTPALGTPSAVVLTNGTGLPIIAGTTGTLTIARGGTGQTTAPNAFNALSPITSTGDLIIGNGAKSATRLATGSANTVLKSDGTTGSWGSISNTNLSGSAAISNANLAAMPANTAKANLTGGSAVPSDAPAVSANTPSSFVVRDGSSNFAAGVITASLSGHATQDLALTGGTMSGNIAMGGNGVTGMVDPTLAQDAATKAYVDAHASGITPIAGVVAATTGDLTGTYANGASCVGATFTLTAVGALVLDGVSLSLNDRVLVKNQVSQFQIGVYTVTVVGNGATQAVLTRATDFDSAGEIVKGALVAVQQGTTLAGSSWLQTATISSCGTDPVLFSQFTPPNTGNFLVKTNNLSDVSDPVASFNNLSPMSALGDLIGGSTAGSRVRIPGSISSTKKFLQQVGTGSVSALATWGDTNFSDLIGNLALGQLPTAVTWPSSGTAVSTTPSNHAVLISGSSFLASTAAPSATAGLALVSAGSSSDPTFGAVDLSATGSVSNTLPVARGGTGISGGTSGGIPYFTAAGTQIASSLALGAHAPVIGGGPGAAPTTIGTGSAGQPLLSAGSSVDPAYAALNLAGAGVTGILPNANTTGDTAATASTLVLRDVSANITAAKANLSSANVSGLTASQAVVTDASKNLASLPYSITPASLTLAEYNAQSNLRANNVSLASQSVASAGSTTTLIVGSPATTYVTGSANQTVQLPITSTTFLNQKYTVVNQSTGTVTINSSGSNLVASLAPGQQADLSVVSNAGTSAASWYSNVSASNTGAGTVTSVALAVPSSSIFGVTGSPVTTAGTLAFTTTGTSGGIPYFSTASAISSSASLINNSLIVGGGAGGAPKTFATGATSGNVLTANGGVLIWAPTDLTNVGNSVSGTLTTASGGTGLSQTNSLAWTNHSIPITNGVQGAANPMTLLAPGATTGTPLLNNAGADAAYGPLNLSTAGVTSGVLGVGKGGTGTSTAFTTGSVLYAGASGVYTQNNAGFFFDGSRLGIGTNSLSFPLQVSSTQGNNFGIVDTTNTQTLGFTSTSSGFSVINSAAKDLILGTNAGERLRILGGGNVGYVGINQASPQSRLHVSSAQQDVAQLNYTTGGGGSHSYLTFNTTNTLTNVGARIGQVDNGSAGGHFVIETNNTGPGNTTVERLRVTDAGNVGIADTNPASRLSVGGITGSTATLGLGVPSADQTVNGQAQRVTLIDNDAHALGTSSGDWFFNNGFGGRGFHFRTGTNSSDQLTINNTGSVGIGSSIATGAALDVTTAGWNYMTSASGATPAAAKNFGLMFGYNRSQGNAESSILYGSAVNTPYLEIGRWDGTTITPDMEFNTGKVGIGTASNVVPSQKLQVQDTDAAILVGQSDGTHGALYFGNTNHGIKRSPNGTNNDIAVFTAGGANVYLSATGESGQTVTVTNNGRVGVNNNTPNNAFTVAGGADFSNDVAIGTTTAAARLYVSNTGTSAEVAAFRNSVGTCLITPNNTSLSCSSDSRLKDNIEDMASQEAIDLVMSLAPKHFAWKSDKEHKIVAGFIAQDVQKVLPELVSVTKTDGMLSLSQVGMIPYMVKAMQEMKHENDDLKARLEKLEAKAVK